MDPGLRTPLLDYFRRGDVATDVRLLAARGVLAPRALEQLALLLQLSDDPDGAVSAEARSTIDRLPAGPLAEFIARSEVPDQIRAYFHARGVEPAPVPGGDRLEPLIETEAGDEASGAPDASRDPPLASLSVPARLRVAMSGTREQRALLIRDPNRMVAVAVLSSPKLTESEIESFARMTTVSDDILRIIGLNRSWTKKYPVMLALVRNPRTPTAIALPFVSRLNDRDLRLVMIDRNVPEPVRMTARKFAASAASRRR